VVENQANNADGPAEASYDAYVMSQEQIIAIGDVHGCASELLTLMEQLPITPDTTLLFVGDYIDRGRHSREVVDLILQARPRCHVVTPLGNHEAMLLNFLFDRTADTAGLFVFNGGSATLASYADDTGDFSIPNEHLDFFKVLQLAHQTEDCFFVHAGAPDVPLEELDSDVHREELLWSRKFRRSSFEWSKVIVHGHTQVEQVELLPHRINVDTGCAYDNMLSAVELPSLRVTSLPRMRETRGTVLCDVSSRRKAVRFKGPLPVHVMMGDREVAFETLDYSPIGFFLRLVSPCDERPLSVGDVLLGTIGKGSPGMVQFRGRVIRELMSRAGLFYGVQITDHG